MIERVLIAGEDVEPGEVLAELKIRHGRGSVDDGPLASTANLTLVGVTRERVAAFSVGDELELLLAGDVPRFRGRITDADLTTEGLALVAVSSLARAARQRVGVDAWPAESWLARLIRVFSEARLAREWQEATGTWADPEAPAWLDLGLLGFVTLDTVDEGPQLVARDPGETTAAAYLGGPFRASEDAAMANLPDGNVLVQQLSVRASKPELELDSSLVAYAPDFAQTDEVENELVMTWAGGEVASSATGSIARFEVHPARVETELADAPDVAALATLRIARRAFPRWTSTPVQLLALEPELAIGTPVRLHDLPDWAPASAYLGIVEGWEDTLEPDGAGGLAWSMSVFLSDPRLSGGFGILWAHPVGRWSQAAPATWAFPGLAPL